MINRSTKEDDETEIFVPADIFVTFNGAQIDGSLLFIEIIAIPAASRRSGSFKEISCGI
jgi:hypothetical protein